MKLNSFFLAGVLVAGSIALAEPASAAPVVGWAINNPVAFSNGSWSFGEVFTVGNSNINVVDLGAFDAGGDGFATMDGIPVGIFRESDGVLLASTFVLSTDALTGNYRFHSITSVELLANTQYRVVADNEFDAYNVATGTPDNIDPSLTWNSYGYCRTSSLTDCNDYTGTERTWMANLVLDTATPVPEPASLALLGAGLFGLGFLRRHA